jgi:hypothetical protein
VTAEARRLRPRLRCYRALGFEAIGDYGFVFFRT